MNKQILIKRIGCIVVLEITYDNGDLYVYKATMANLLEQLKDKAVNKITVKTFHLTNDERKEVKHAMYISGRDYKRRSM